MQRRDFVRGLALFGVAPRVLLAQQAAAPPPPAPVPWMLGLNAKTPLPHTVTVDAVADTDPNFFHAEQMATLTRLNALLMPSLNGRPGAVEAETPAFLDFLIGCSPPARQTLYTGGLDWLDALSKKSYGVPFGKLQPTQADALVQPWLCAWMSDHPPTETHAEFLNIAHADIRMATMNSEAWSHAAPAKGQEAAATGLYWSPIEPDMYAEDPGRVHVRPSAVIAAPKASHTTPSYPH